MITNKEIVKEGSPILRNKSIKVSLPIDEETIKTLDLMCEYLKNSQDPEIAEKYELTPGVGLAAPQIGLNLRMFSILDGDFNYGIINPEIIKESKRQIYLQNGEGCLSCPGKGGIVKRSKKIVAECILYNPVDKTLEQTRLTLEDYLAIVFQHEFDHLNGVLFVDKVTENLNDAEPIE